MIFNIFQLIVTVISILLFLRVYWIQAGSNSLISMMNMQKNGLLNEIEISNSSKELSRENVIESLSYLNLVSKLYLNHCININMLRTFEGVMIKLLKNEKTKIVYQEIFHEFQTNIKTAEPPYINLIYASHMLVDTNKILNKRALFSPLFSWFYLVYKKIYFNYRSSSLKNWKLASNVFDSINKPSN